MRHGLGSGEDSKNKREQQKRSPLAAVVILGIILAATGIVAYSVEHFIGQAQIFKTAGLKYSPFWESLIPYHETVKTLAELMLLPGIAFFFGPVLMILVKSGVMRARVLETGIPVPGMIMEVNQYTEGGSKGGVEYVSTFELEVRPPGIAPFQATVMEYSRDVYDTEYVIGSTIAVLYEPQTRILRVPDPDFDEVEHNQRSRKVAKFTGLLFYAVVKRWLKKNTVLFIVMLFPFAIAFGGLLISVEDIRKWGLFGAAIITVLFVAIYAGLTSNDPPEPEEKKRHAPPPFKGVG